MRGGQGAAHTPLLSGGIKRLFSEVLFHRYERPESDGNFHSAFNSTQQLMMGVSFDRKGIQKQTFFLIGFGSCFRSMTYIFFLDGPLDIIGDTFVVRRLFVLATKVDT